MTTALIGHTGFVGAISWRRAMSGKSTPGSFARTGKTNCAGFTLVAAGFTYPTGIPLLVVATHVELVAKESEPAAMSLPESLVFWKKLGYIKRFRYEKYRNAWFLTRRASERSEVASIPPVDILKAPR